ncbi:MAG: lamin tail domain-containing protein [Verrucomicrobiota bacterium]
MSAIGAAPLHYQWQSNGIAILAATNVTYAIASAQSSDAASYSVVVTNFAGSVTSAPAVLTVNSGTAANVVISQIYGGGGNSGATYRNDYVELFNPGSLPASVNGWSVQYASASGSTWQVGNLTGTIPGGGYYLVQLSSSGANGSLLPVANVTNNINVSGSNGKLALVTNQVALSGANPVGGVTIADFVGYGTAGAYEGSGAAPTGGNAAAIFRNNAGATDTDDNAADFSTGVPNPRSSVVTNPPVATGIDLAILKSHAGSFAQGDAGRTYTITVTNVGSLATTGAVSVVDVLPAGLTATAMTGSGWSITLGTLTATRADVLTANAAYPAITLTVTVASNAPASLTNLASVATGGDTNTLNNTASDLTSITATNSGGGGDNYTGVLAGWDVSGQSSYGISPFAATTSAPNVTVVGLTRGAGVGTEWLRGVRWGMGWQ